MIEIQINTFVYETVLLSSDLHSDLQIKVKNDNFIWTMLLVNMKAFNLPSSQCLSHSARILYFSTEFSRWKKPKPEFNEKIMQRPFQ